MIFVAHSLGGLVVKQVRLIWTLDGSVVDRSQLLVDIHKRTSQGDKTTEFLDQKGFYDSIAGLVFMGTPHLGSAAGQNIWITVLKSIGNIFSLCGPDNIIDALEARSGALNKLSSDFAATSIFKKEEIKMASFYECMTTPPLGQEVSNLRC